MTIEEYIAEELNNTIYPGYNFSPGEIEFLGIQASPSHVWSKYTAEEFSAYIKYKLRGTTASMYLSETKVCEFLNKLFPAEE